MFTATILIRPAAPSMPLHYETRYRAGASKCRSGVCRAKQTACLDLIGTNVSLISMVPSRRLAAPLPTFRANLGMAPTARPIPSPVRISTGGDKNPLSKSATRLPPDRLYCSEDLRPTLASNRRWNVSHGSVPVD
jgi:hypothetical protein